MVSPPLCNVCAIFDPDPTRRSEHKLRLAQSGFFAAVHSLANGWLVALCPLNGSVEAAQPKRARAALSGLFFCEGKELFDAPEAALTLATALDQDPERLATLPGDFTLLRLSERGTAVLVRSCAGRVPLYYATAGDRVVLGSRLDYLVAFGLSAPRLDGLATALALSGYGVSPNGRTPIEGVRGIPSAHFLTLEANRTLNPVRYWSPRQALQRPTAERKAHHAIRLHQGLTRVLDRELQTQGGNLLWLSGGVDSSALAALAAGELKRPLWTHTFTAPDQDTARYEDSYLLSLQERYRFPRTWRETKTPERYLELIQNAPRVAHPVSYFPLCALKGLSREAQIHTAMGGELADEGTGSHRNLGDWLDHTGPLELLRVGQNSPSGYRALRQWITWRSKRPWSRQAVRLPASLGPSVRADVEQEFLDWAHDQRVRFANDRAPLRTLWFRVQQDAWRAEWWEAATALGVRPLAPYCTRELLELYFDCHPLEWFDGQRPKAVLRRSMEGRMPCWHNERPDKGVWPGYLDGVHLSVDPPPLNLGGKLLSESWWHSTFAPSGLQPAQLPALEALKVSCLSNLLHAVHSLSGTHKALEPEKTHARGPDAVAPLAQQS